MLSWWIVHPGAWPLDPTSPESVLAGLGARADLWSGAEVVGTGWTARTVRELHVVAHGLVRLLVERLGFRSVLVEGDRAMSKVLDGFVRTGAVHGGADDLSSPAALERSLAHQVTEWHEPHGDRIVYLGGTNHTWLHDTDRIRFVGPAYDPHDDANHAMTGDPRTWFDILVHQKIATSVKFPT
jgi:hypothetical protein